uniref:Uncharacterized protein n=1 Tax=Eptatretus burgeri TaxID=7764 RepID=A0A8C4WZ55_EPTBU
MAKMTYVVLLGFLMLFWMGCCMSLEFTGTADQWQRYLRWDQSANGNLSFKFKTNSSEGLLIYIDDGGICDYLELFIKKGKVQLHFFMHCDSHLVLETSKLVNDGKWHSLHIWIRFKHVTLTVDGEMVPGDVISRGQHLSVSSDLFLGGIPPSERVEQLTSKHVKHRIAFKGFIMNLQYGNAMPILISSKGVRSRLDQLCLEQNPCKNGGACSVVGSEITCDCGSTGFQGRYCHEDVIYGEGFMHLMVGDQGSHLNPAEYITVLLVFHVQCDALCRPSREWMLKLDMCMFVCMYMQGFFWGFLKCRQNVRQTDENITIFFFLQPMYYFSFYQSQLSIWSQQNEFIKLFPPLPSPPFFTTFHMRHVMVT